MKIMKNPIKVKKVLLTAAAFAMAWTAVNSFQSNQVFASTSNLTDMTFYNYNIARGDDVLLDDTDITAVTEQGTLPLTGVNTIRIDSAYADTTVVLEDRDDISVEFKAQGKLVDNFELSCVKLSDVAAITLGLKKNSSPLLLSYSNLEIHLPLSYKNNYSLNNDYGSLTVDGDISCKRLKGNWKQSEVTFNNNIVADHVEFFYENGGSFTAKNVDADLVLLNGKETNTSFANIDASDIQIETTDNGSFNAGNITAENTIEINSRNTEITVNTLEADVITADISDGEEMNVNNMEAGTIDINAVSNDVIINNVDGTKENVDVTLYSSELFANFGEVNSDITISGDNSPVEIKLPRNAKFTADFVTTEDGKIKNNFDFEVKEAEGDLIRQEMTGVSEEGDYLIAINMQDSDITFSGYR